MGGRRRVVKGNNLAAYKSKVKNPETQIPNPEVRKTENWEAKIVNQLNSFLKLQISSFENELTKANDEI